MDLTRSELGIAPKLFFGLLDKLFFGLLDNDGEGQLFRKEYEAGFTLVDIDRDG